MKAPEFGRTRDRNKALGASRATDTRPGGELTHANSLSAASSPLSKPDEMQRNGEADGVAVGVGMRDAVEVREVDGVRDGVCEAVEVGVGVVEPVRVGVLVGTGEAVIVEVPLSVEVAV